MIKVIFFTDEAQALNGFRISGHAGFARQGRDIICAAVSVLTINTINSIEQLTEDQFKYEQRDGFTELNMITLSDSSKLLLQSMKLGIEGIIKDNGNRYVKIVK